MTRSMKTEDEQMECAGADCRPDMKFAEPASPGETRFCLTISASKLKLDVEIDSKTIGEEDGRFVFALVQEFASYWRERK